MKKTLTGMVMLSLVSSIALAGDYYGGIDVGYGKGSTERKVLGDTQDDDFTLTGFGIHGGYNLDMNSKVEISLSSLNFDLDDGDVDGMHFGVDYIYTFDEVSKLKPYIGIGLSLNSLDVKIANSDTIDGVGLRLRAGSYYALTPKIDIGVELNYNAIGWEDLQNKDTGAIHESSSTFYGLALNANYKF